MVQAQIDNTHFAEVKAPWQGVNLDDYGYIWLVMPYTTVEAEGESGPRQRVLSPQGEYLGECALPRDMVGFSRGFVTVRRTDPETHQEQYIVYRMVPAAEGFKYP